MLREGEGPGNDAGAQRLRWKAASGCARDEELECHSAGKEGSPVVSEMLKFLIYLNFRNITQESLWREGRTRAEAMKM